MSKFNKKKGAKKNKMRTVIKFIFIGKLLCNLPPW